MASTGGSETTDGPVLSLMNKRIRALRKKYNRILQMEESMSQGKPLNKEQEDVLRSKPVVTALIEEYEKLRQPLHCALQEELQQAMVNLNATPPENHDSSRPSEEVSSETTMTPRGESDAVEDLLKLLYFGTLFDVKPPNELKSIILTRVHERTSCLTYDYVTEDATDLLAERDLDLLSLLGSLVIARPANSTLSHKNALNTCLQHAKLWIQNSEQPIYSEVNISYAELREKLSKILSLEYFTTTPEMMTLSQQSTAEAGVTTGNCVSQIPVDDSTLPGPVIQAENISTLYQQKAEDTEKFQALEKSPASNVHADQYTPIEEQQLPKDDEGEESLDQGDAVAAVSSLPQDHHKLQQQLSDGEDQQQYYNPSEEVEFKEQHQQYVPQRVTGYPRGNRGGGRRGGGGGYMNGRGASRGGNRGGRGYQNGRSQYYDQGNYYPQRNFYNQRGRGGRGGDTPAYNNGRTTMTVESDHA